MTKSLLLLTAVAAASLPGCQKRPSPPAGPSITINGKTWHVELALTHEQRYRGLSGRPALDEDAGMLFIYPDAAVRHYGMRGCIIPLEIAFIGPDLKVIAVYTMAVEPDLVGRRTYRSPAPAQYVLETAEGSLRRADVKRSDTIVMTGVDAAKAQPGP